MRCAPTAWPPSSFSPSSSAPLGAIGMFTLCTPAGTNEQAIIDVLTKRSNAQRQQIAKSFKAQFGKVKGGQEAFLGSLGGLLGPETAWQAALFWTRPSARDQLLKA